MSLSALIETIAKALVDEPDKVIVRDLDGNLELQVSPDDIGKVIGKDGRTAQAMRALLGAAALKAGRRVHLDIVD